MATANYNINYDDERFQTVESEKEAALNDVNNTYNNMISQSDKFYEDQKAAIQDYADTQQQLQQENTNFTIEQINQQKDQANKDYTKEQKGAYVDWQKQSNQYGANAEQMAASGLSNTGYSESSQVSMYNQYQGRVATARETYNKAILNYDNAIKDAQLQNNSKLAEIAYNALQAQLELSLEGFQYKNSLLSEQIQMQQQTEDRYYSRWQDVLNQMNTENQFAESIRQYEQNYQLQQQQFAEEKRQFELSYNQQVKEFNESIRQFNEEIARLKKKDEQEYKLEIQQLELQKQQLEQAKKEAERDYQIKQQQLAEQIRSNKAAESISWYNATTSRTAATSGGGYTGGGYTDSYEVNTAYYKGSKAKDVGGFGYMANEYQPKGVMINGNAYQVSKSGATYTFKTQTLSGQTQTVTQNVWMANGKYYYWEGRENQYKELKYNSKTGTFSPK